MSEKSKIFVLDTNVILHDYRSIYNFEENDIVIPITVLEELDHFKKGGDLKGYHAREFMRVLDALTDHALITEGVKIREDLGTLSIATGKKFSEEMERSFAEKTEDHRILAVADYYRREFPDRKVVLVTQDINFRMKAKSLGINAEDYENGKVTNLEDLESKALELEGVDDSFISHLYQSSEGIPTSDFEYDNELDANEFFILKGSNSTALATYDAKTQTIRKVTKRTAYHISPRNAEQTFALNALLNPDIQLVTLMGKAGTGKTLLALAAALEQRHDFEQILLARPIVPLSNRDIGFLPGDEKAKIAPYMQPLFDNLNVIKQQFSKNSKDYQRLDEMEKDEELVITPLAYIRGRSLSKVFFIIDEAQNLTPHEVKTIITRAGEGTKIVFTGDIYQIDSPYLDKHSNGLSYLADKMKGQELFAHVNLVQGERSHLSELASDLL